jgi:signal transduction histidine kinase
LARESDDTLSRDDVCVNDVIAEEIDRAQMLNPQKELTINYNADYRIHTRTSDKVLSVLIGNLIRNAFLYTERGSIDINVKRDSIIIRDSGKGMARQQINEVFKPYYRGDNNNTPGHGVGMTIVKRLSDRFNWPVNIKSSPGQGTIVEVRFPDSGPEAPKVSESIEK